MLRVGHHLHGPLYLHEVHLLVWPFYTCIGPITTTLGPFTWSGEGFRVVCTGSALLVASVSCQYSKNPLLNFTARKNDDNEMGHKPISYQDEFTPII